MIVVTGGAGFIGSCVVITVVAFRLLLLINRRRGEGMVCFYVHQGNQDYFKASITHLKRKIPHIQIIVLAKTEEEIIEGVKSIKVVDSYDGLAKEFAKKYVHISANKFEYEKFCFERWFYIKEFMEKNNINDAIYIDSDVLLNNINRDYVNSQGRFFICSGSGHTSFFSYKQLSCFCDYVLKKYEDRKSVEKLKTLSDYKIHNGEISGISDMTLITMYALKTGNVGDLAHISHLSVYDHNVNISDGFEMNGSQKSIYYYNDSYYFKDLSTGIMIKANSLHFQGDAKRFMNTVSDTHLCNKDVWMIYNYNGEKWVDMKKKIFRGSKQKKVKKMVYKIRKRIEMDRSFKSVH